MKASAFDYARPRDLQHALKILSENEDAKAAAGTQSLGPMLNLRLLQPKLLVDLRFIEELKSFKEEKGSVTLGACITHAQIEDGAHVGEGRAGHRRERERSQEDLGRRPRAAQNRPLKPMIGKIVSPRMGADC